MAVFLLAGIVFFSLKRWRASSAPYSAFQRENILEVEIPNFYGGSDDIPAVIASTEPRGPELQNVEDSGSSSQAESLPLRLFSFKSSEPEKYGSFDNIDLKNDEPVYTGTITIVR